MKTKEPNYYVGKKGYSDVTQLPHPDAVPYRYPLKILESFENICLAEVDNEVHIYFMSGNTAERGAEGPWRDEGGHLKSMGTSKELKSLFDRTVEARKKKNENREAIQAQSEEKERRIAEHEAAVERKEARSKEWITTKKALQAQLKELKEGKTLRQQMKNSKVRDIIFDLNCLTYLKP